MEQVIPHALERIDNPILLILLAALLIAVSVLWFAKQRSDARQVEMLCENIAAIKDMTTAINLLREDLRDTLSAIHSTTEALQRFLNDHQQ